MSTTMLFLTLFVLLMAGVLYIWYGLPRFKKPGIPDYPAPPPPPEPLLDASQLSNDEVHEMWMDEHCHRNNIVTPLIDAVLAEFPLKVADLLQGEVYKHVLNKQRMLVVQCSTSLPVMATYTDKNGVFLIQRIHDGELYPTVPEQNAEAQAALREVQLEFLRKQGKVK